MNNQPSLRDRAAGNEVAQRNDNAPVATQIQQMEAHFQMAMPRGVEAKQLVRDALTALRTTPKLAEADPRTVLGALMTCAQLGLRPGVLGHAWVLPFYDNRSRGQKAQLVIGYQGLVELAHRSGKIASLIARTVFSKDYFDVAYGLDDRLDHKPFMDGDRGDPIAYYAIVKLNTGGRAFIVMSHAEVEAHRDKNAMAKTREGKIVGPWRDNFEAMAHKTCVLKLAKWMPKGTDLATAMASDEGVRINVDAAMGAESVTHRMDQPDTPAGDGDGDNFTEALRNQCLDAGREVGLDGDAVKARFAEQNEGAWFVDGSVEQLQAFHAWLSSPEAKASA